jgi:hypothetical protein
VLSFNLLKLHKELILRCWFEVYEDHRALCQLLLLIVILDNGSKRRMASQVFCNKLEAI